MAINPVVFMGSDEEYLEYFTVFMNDDGETIVVPDSLHDAFLKSVWFNSYNIEVGVNE